MQIKTKIEIVKHSFVSSDQQEDEIDFSVIGVDADDKKEDISEFPEDMSIKKIEYLFVDGIIETKNFDYATKSVDYEDEEDIVSLWKITESGPVPLNIKYKLEKLKSDEVFTN